LPFDGRKFESWLLGNSLSYGQVLKTHLLLFGKEIEKWEKGESYNTFSE
jgi:hypothetical protein